MTKNELQNYVQAYLARGGVIRKCPPCQMTMQPWVHKRIIYRGIEFSSRMEDHEMRKIIGRL